ncbi:hypothetical protein V1506DRAFT_550760 [Lipomyces tetrasporus]
MDVETTDIPERPANNFVLDAVVSTVAVGLLRYVAIVILAVTAIEDNGYSRLSSKSSERFVSEDDGSADGTQPVLGRNPMYDAQGTIATSSIERTAAYLRHEAIPEEGGRVDDAQLEARLLERNLTYAGRHPVTSSLRRTAAYLRHEAGPWSLFRGMSAYIAKVAATVQCKDLGLLILPNILQPFNSVSRFALNYKVNFVDIVKHYYHGSDKENWFVRLRHTPLRLSLLTLPVLATEFIVHKFMDLLPNIVIFKVAWPSMVQHGLLFGGLMLLLGIAAYLAVFVFLSVPATIVRIRVQASLLPDEEQPIVPFDRKSFGTISSLRDAMYGVVSTWKTVGSSDRKRYVMSVVKLYVIGAAVVVVITMLWIPSKILRQKKILYIS